MNRKPHLADAVSSSMSPALASLYLVSGEELAALLRFDGVTSRFREWCSEMGIKPLPGRRDVYDPVHVRRRLDAAHAHEVTPANDVSPALTPMELRRARREQG